MKLQKLFDEKKFKEIIKQSNALVSESDITILAYAYQKEGNWEKAMETWNKLIVQSPTNAYFYSERGVCKFNLRFKHAIQDFNKAVELEPTNAYFYSCRAYVKDKTGDSEGAVEDYQTAHNLDPSDAITLNNLGLAEQKLGYTARARERFKDSDDLLGITTIDSRSEPESNPPKSNVWLELKKMVTTKEGFRTFLRDLGLLK